MERKKRSAEKSKYERPSKFAKGEPIEKGELIDVPSYDDEFMGEKIMTEEIESYIKHIGNFGSQLPPEEKNKKNIYFNEELNSLLGPESKDIFDVHYIKSLENVKFYSEQLKRKDISDEEKNFYKEKFAKYFRYAKIIRKYDIFDNYNNVWEVPTNTSDNIPIDFAGKKPDDPVIIDKFISEKSETFRIIDLLIKHQLSAIIGRIFHNRIEKVVGIDEHGNEKIDYGIDDAINKFNNFIKNQHELFVYNHSKPIVILSLFDDNPTFPINFIIKKLKDDDDEPSKEFIDRIKELNLDVSKLLNDEKIIEALKNLYNKVNTVVIRNRTTDLNMSKIEIDPKFKTLNDLTILSMYHYPKAEKRKTDKEGNILFTDAEMEILKEHKQKLPEPPVLTRSIFQELITLIEINPLKLEPKSSKDIPYFYAYDYYIINVKNVINKICRKIIFEILNIPDKNEDRFSYDIVKQIINNYSNELLLINYGLYNEIDNVEELEKYNSLPYHTFDDED